MLMLMLMLLLLLLMRRVHLSQSNSLLLCVTHCLNAAHKLVVVVFRAVCRCRRRGMSPSLSLYRRLGA
jgi:hypothetical protein